MAAPFELITTERPSRRFVVIVTLLYLTITAFIAVHHEPWRDEADEWLLVRDADFATIFGRTGYAGTPVFWYLLIAPLAKLGLPYASQKVLHIAIATAAIAVFSARAPLTRLTKVLAAFSYFFAYEYAVIVRTYALTVLLTFIVAAMYSSRRERPIAFAIAVFLLFNVNAQGFAIAGVFALLFMLDFGRRVQVVPTLIMAAGAVITYLQVRTPPDPARHAVAHVFNREAFAWVVGNAFLPTLPVAVTFIIGMLVLAAITFSIWKARDAVLLLWLTVAGLSILYTYIWLGGMRHAGFFLLLAIVSIWIAGTRLQRPFAAAALLHLTLLISVMETVRYAVLDYREAFSGSQEMANYLLREKLTGVPIAAHNLTQCEAVLPFLPGTRFWYAGLSEQGSYMMWDAAFERALNVPYPVAEERAKRRFAGQRWLLLFNVEMPDPPAHGFRLLYTNQQRIFEKTDERYWLYAPLR